MYQFIFRISSALFLLLLSNESVLAQEYYWIERDSTKKIDTFMMLQAWSIFSHGMRVDPESDGTYENVDPRFQAHLRRARLGFRANPYKRTNFTLVLEYDGLGRDALDASSGGANNPPDAGIGIFDAMLGYQISNKPFTPTITLGYFRPQIARENITSGFVVSSGEKAWQQEIIRSHLVGSSQGRAPGVNFGGIYNFDSKRLQFLYDAGIFHPNNTSELPNTVGIEWAPLWVGRVVLSIGDNEQENYSLSHKTNYFGKRKGVSFGINAAYQGQTDIFRNNSTLGADVLLNLGPFNFDADFHRNDRSAFEFTEQGAQNLISSVIYAGHIRASCNFKTRKGKLLEPTLMINRFWGSSDPEEKRVSETLEKQSGNAGSINIGLNYLLDEQNLKIIFHYVIEHGTEGINKFTVQDAVGVPIRRGNYAVLGINMLF